MTRGEWVFWECDLIFLNILIFSEFHLKIASLALLQNNMAPCLKTVWRSYVDAILAIFTFVFNIFNIKNIVNTLLLKQKNIILKFIM